MCHVYRPMFAIKTLVDGVSDTFKLELNNFTSLVEHFVEIA